VESIFLLASALFGFGALAVFLLIKEKLLSGVFAAVAAVFLVLNFYSDHQASKTAGQVDLKHLEAVFAADWAEANNKPQAEQDRLKARAIELEKESAAASEKARQTLESNALARQPLESLSTQKVDALATEAEAPKSNF
jgi:flagellar basal body-associated protein FliL